MIPEREKCTWPNLMYRFAEHYKWETQHLRGSIKEFYAKIRRQEVPLNFLFSLLLRSSSSGTILTILKKFGLSDSEFGQSQLNLEYPLAIRTQPDLVIESDDARIFIEIKVGSKIALLQVQRYLLLHAELDIADREKRPYLLFLTEGEFKKCWSPAREALAVDDVSSFLKKLTIGPVPSKLRNKVGDKRAIHRYEEVKRKIRYGAATWPAIGACLAQIASQWRISGANDIETRILDDFIDDLRQRGYVT